MARKSGLFSSRIPAYLGLPNFQYGNPPSIQPPLPSLWPLAPASSSSLQPPTSAPASSLRGLRPNSFSAATCHNSLNAIIVIRQCGRAVEHAEIRG